MLVVVAGEGEGSFKKGFKRAKWVFLLASIVVATIVVFTLSLVWPQRGSGMEWRMDVMNTRNTSMVVVEQHLITVEDGGLLPPQPLGCIEKLLVELNNARDRFDATTFDLLQIVIRGLNTWDQKMNLLRPIQNQEGFYIKTETELRQKLDQQQFQRCSNESLPKVALCTVQHSNGPYIQEFISHYLLLGVSKFFIYDNSKPGSPESVYFRNVVQPFVDTGIVVVRDWYFEQGNTYRQIPAFDHCVRNNDEYDWIALFDSDEFLVIHEPHPPCINQLLTNFTSYAGLSVFWRLMSPLGVGPYRDPSRLLMDQTGYQIPNIIGTVKVILQPKYFRRMKDAHSANYTEPHYSIDFHGNKVVGANVNVYRPKSWVDIELRHFYGRDWSYYLYDKICSQTRYTAPLWHNNRVKRLLEAFLTGRKVETETQHNELLRRFLSLPEPEMNSTTSTLDSQSNDNL